ncbi:hypothetical protein BDQ12DRAFT_681428 [Crucibulum laeve]|uniref:Uncharacterized protein n=1 Tax=Crucibulum laeve TaxID=68775 RepID=A0A5C3M7R3_9AGAR|nr:hypothetical protein BDQ12DRAFT_681428 [Crucibulum laeve]
MMKRALVSSEQCIRNVRNWYLKSGNTSLFLSTDATRSVIIMRWDRQMPDKQPADSAHRV